MNWKRLREKVLEKHYPGEEELEEARDLYQKISDYIAEDFGLETHFAGSTSRETCMAGDKDIDVFVLFSPELSQTALEEQGLKVGKNVFREFDGTYRVEYAEHPYTKGEIDGHEVEIVPCYDVPADQIKSSVDRTPHHSRWADAHLDKEQRKDVVVLKSFLRAHGIYGSSLKVRGFSGYLCEILIAEFGSFNELVESAVDWDRQEIIDPEDHHDALPEKLKKKFDEDSLVVIDPVDPERNVASVLDTENYAKFIYACWKFQRKPGIGLFTQKDVVYDQFELEQEIDRRADFIVIEFEPPEEVEDIVYPQMRKTVRLLENRLRSEDFRVYDSGFHIGEKARIVFELERSLPEVENLEGPRLFHGSDHIDQFASKYDNVFVEGDRLHARVEREYTDAKQFFKDFLDGDRHELKERGVPGYVAEKMTEHTFSEPVVDDEKWLKYMAEKLHVAEHE